MNQDIDFLLDDLRDILLNPDGDPTSILTIFNHAMDICGALCAHSNEAKSALRKSAMHLLDMFYDPLDPDAVPLRNMKDRLLQNEYLPGQSASGSDPSVAELREENRILRAERDKLEQLLEDSMEQSRMIANERDTLKDALEKAQAQLADLRPAKTQSDPDPAFTVRTKTKNDLRKDTYGTGRKNDLQKDTYFSFAPYLITSVDLSRSQVIPRDAQHVRITALPRAKNLSYVPQMTVFDHPRLQSVEFTCQVDSISAHAFYHTGPLSLKFCNGECHIYSGAFSPDTQIIRIAAPLSSNPDSLQQYAKTNGIAFFYSPIE